ncbi:MAG: prepilin-type N-terminal cleavage/methylation domain-containing protein [Gemmatimonadaceae bacterium]
MSARRHAAEPRIASRDGFTLPELAIVVVIVGIMVGFAIPRFPISGMRADAAVRIMRAELQSAQRSAITRQSNIVVAVDVANNRLRILEDVNSDEVASPGERVRMRPIEENVRLRAPGMGRVNGAALTAEFVGTNLRTRDGLPSIVFRRDGSASTDLEIYLSSTANEVNSWRGVTVAPSTGRADAWRRTAADWRRMRP